jgi:hypothetical protein
MRLFKPSAVVVSLYLTLVFVPLTPAQEQTHENHIENYLQYVKSLPRYSCAMAGELTFDDSKPNDSAFCEAWNIHSYDPTSKIHRHDDMPQSKTDASGYSEQHGTATLFVKNDVEYTQNVASTQRKAALGGMDANDQIGRLMPQSYFEPFSAPFIGSALRNYSLRLSHHLEKSIDKHKFVEEWERDPFIVQRFSLSKTEPFFHQVAFDATAGFMPAESRRTEEARDSAAKVIQETTTKWKKVGDYWLPFTTESVSPMRTTRITWKIRYYWMLEDVPETVFAMDRAKSLDADKLRRLAVDSWNKKIGDSK